MYSIRNALCILLLGACRSTTTTPTDAPPTDAAVPPPDASARATDQARFLRLTNPGNLPVYAGPVGAIHGRVVTSGPAASAVTADTQSCPKAAPQYARAFREGPADASGTRPVADAVVVVTGYSGFYIPEARTRARVVFADCDFETHTVTMTLGQQLEVVNKTDVPFAPRLVPSPPSVWLVAPPQERGEPIHLTPEAPGYLRLVDQLGRLKYLELGVYVLLHPLHTVSKPDGSFRIEGIPAQKLMLGGRLANGDRTGARDVDVLAGGDVEIELLLEPKAATALKDAGRR